MIGCDNIAIPIFLSYPKPFNDKQNQFIDKVIKELKKNGFEHKTFGENYYGMSVPLTEIKQMMNECYGLLSIAFKRTYVREGIVKHGANLVGQVSHNISDCWLTSPYCQVEPAMASQIDMPFLIFREKGVTAEGILEKGVIDSYMPEFDIDVEGYFNHVAWTHLFEEWKERVIEYKTKKQFKTDDIIEHIMSYCICEGKKMSSDDLYKMFENTVDPTQKNHAGKKMNDPDHFIRQLESYLDVDDIEARYNLPGHSIVSDYITICQSFFY